MCYEESEPAKGASAKQAQNDGRGKSGPSTPAPRSHSPAALNDALRDLSIGANRQETAARHDAQPSRGSSRRSAGPTSSAARTGSSSPIETPPESPRPGISQPRRDSSFRRTYDDTVTKRQGPCDNCAMTLPRRQGCSISLDEAGANAHGPTLRTRAPVERVFGTAGQASPPNSRTSSDTDGDRATTRRVRSRKPHTASSSRNTSCSSTSTTSERTPYHFHYVSYTSTREPIQPDSFSLIRASCLRALSFETLPRPPPTSTPTSSPQLNNSPSFVTTQSAGSTATGGPIFFGDALAGYTTAYIFRIPDMHARGHKRVYAFLALSTHKERLAMKTFSMVSTAFRDLATWIQQLAEAEAERTSTTNTSPIGSVMYSGGGQPQPPPSTFDSPSGVDRTSSSFLAGGSAFTRRMGGGPGASSLKARGLAELVGQPDFFIELHGKFVQMLFEVGVALNS